MAAPWAAIFVKDQPYSYFEFYTYLHAIRCYLVGCNEVWPILFWMELISSSLLTE